MIKHITTPLTPEIISSLQAGDKVSISGIIYSARDAAHKRLSEMIKKGEKLPIELEGQIIYYVGPCPAKPGTVIGSAGPTTSGRMDAYTPLLLEKGLKGMIGKGFRSKEVVDAIVKYGAVYFGAIGGAGALLADSIKDSKIVAFEDLGPEAIYEFKVENFPAIVIIDKEGDDLYKIGVEKYREI
ncbi:fumarate hydratase subunit beta [Caldanaerovirga acetigignens]|uniref:Fumarate hydratase subunit beta n=1 Tax=Caldanaerovirga acetigignens TaxID=447595 RepID=A0A1M7I991_9FIRM|nr:Fe-S-containing hydro-lyase [Caldanaerovirga acetigignens]SHM37332.1 fumarate hydratase subunit beta [Caldanaerovirga acetigignens]